MYIYDVFFIICFSSFALLCLALLYKYQLGHQVTAHAVLTVGVSTIQLQYSPSTPAQCTQVYRGPHDQLQVPRSNHFVSIPPPPCPFSPSPSPLPSSPLPHLHPLLPHPLPSSFPPHTLSPTHLLLTRPPLPPAAIKFLPNLVLRKPLRLGPQHILSLLQCHHFLFLTDRDQTTSKFCIVLG